MTRFHDLNLFLLFSALHFRVRRNAHHFASEPALAFGQSESESKSSELDTIYKTIRSGK